MAGGGDELQQSLERCFAGGGVEPIVCVDLVGGAGASSVAATRRAMARRTSSLSSIGAQRQRRDRRIGVYREVPQVLSGSGVIQQDASRGRTHGDDRGARELGGNCCPTCASRTSTKTGTS